MIDTSPVSIEERTEFRNWLWESRCQSYASKELVGWPAGVSKTHAHCSRVVLDIVCSSVCLEGRNRSPAMTGV